MERLAYIIVGNEHDLFPVEAAQIMEKRASGVLSEIERQHKIKLPPISFSLRSLATADRKAADVIRRHFKKGPRPEVRIVFSAEEIDAEALQMPFAECDLLVLVKEAAGGVALKFDKSSSAVPTCYVATSDERSARIIEDIIIDITLGNFFRQSSGPIADIVQQNGLLGLYSRKVAYSLKHANCGKSFVISPDARYVALSAIANASDDDISGRAEESYTLWQGLSYFLSALSLVPTPEQAPQSLSALPKVGAFAFRSLRKIGGQLPQKRIERAVSGLADGHYVMIVLRKSVQARKTPNFRNQIKPLFGNRARVNDFVIYGADSFFNQKKLINHLSRASHVYVVKFEIKNGNALLETTG